MKLNNTFKEHLFHNLCVRNGWDDPGDCVVALEEVEWFLTELRDYFPGDIELEDDSC